MAHEPEDEDPVQHQHREHHQAAALQTRGELLLRTVEGEEVGLQPREHVLLLEVVLLVPVVGADPLLPSPLEVLLGPCTGERDLEGVVNPGHAVLLDSTQNGRGVHAPWVPHVLRIGVGVDSHIVIYDSSSSSSFGVVLLDESLLLLEVVAAYLPHGVGLCLLESGGVVVGVDVEIELPEELTGVGSVDDEEAHHVEEAWNRKEGSPLKQEGEWESAHHQNEEEQLQSPQVQAVASLVHDLDSHSFFQVDLPLLKLSLLRIGRQRRLLSLDLSTLHKVDLIVADRGTYSVVGSRLPRITGLDRNGLRRLA